VVYELRLPAFSEDEMRRPTPPYTQYPEGLQIFNGLYNAQEGGSALEMDGSSKQPQMTAGLDLGDKYSYLCLIDTVSGEVIEEGLLCAPLLRLSNGVFALSGR
jgi:hypothetical protein